MNATPWASDRRRPPAAVRVAVIDSGIAAVHPHVGRVTVGVALVGDDPADFADRLGHGTAVAAAIRDHAPDAELLAVRVFATSLATSARVLCAAIDWAADQGATLVNLSVGTTNDAHRALFGPAIERARALGTLVVAAAADRSVDLLPGTLPGVVGVVADDALARDDLVVRSTAAGLRVACSPRPRPIPGVPIERNLAGVSFAVANATGLLARRLLEQPGEDVTAWLVASARGS